MFRITALVLCSSLLLLVALDLLVGFHSPILSGFWGLDSSFSSPCRLENGADACARNAYPTHHVPTVNVSANSSCPSFFRWIHEDLRPWKETGITRNMVERARKTAHFRIVIINGKVYVKKYRQAIQTRDKFTLWGILQLLRWFPGRLPDLELMFDCNDRPTVPARDFKTGRNPAPPPLFRYCSDDASLDIVFPDWSFWGWAEINIKPWAVVSREIRQGNKRKNWEDRVPYAYWKGNPNVAPKRGDLMKCNVSGAVDWNTRLYVQDWMQEEKRGFKKSNLEDQCTHRYKIYIEGWAWSVSEKYIMACDSITLYVRPDFYDFYIRGMIPLKHYWPIRDDSKCRSLKFAVEWGNTHKAMARGIGEAGSRYIQEELKIDYVYGYMFHLLNEYAKLLRFKPKVPSGATELCSESMLCMESGRWREFMEQSLVVAPSEKSPCILSPDDPVALNELRQIKDNATRMVHIWEDEYWKHRDRKQ